jgi:CRISPR-associated protein Csm2
MADFKLWKNREEGKLDPALFSMEAEKWAKELAAENNRNKRLNKRTQIRRFYDEVLCLDTEARPPADSPEKPDEQDRFETLILPRLHMLIAKAAYAKGRELVSDNFVNLIKTGVNQSTEPKDLKVFADFFEAFMGFYRLYGPAN